MISRAPRAFAAGLGALGRHGVHNVARFAVTMVRKKGLGPTVRYALMSSSDRKRELSAMERRMRLQNAEATLDDGRFEETDLNLAFGMSLEHWRQRLAAVAHAKTRDQALSPPRLQRPLMLHVVIAGGGEGEVATTLRSLAALSGGPSAGPVRVWYEGQATPPPELRRSQAWTEAATPDDWVLFLKAGDQLRADWAEAVAPVIAKGRSEVVTFDMVRFEEDHAYPLFLPGANPLMARHVDYCFSRFAMRAGVLRALGPIDTVAPYDLLKSWLAARPLSAARARWRHVFDVVAEIALDPGAVEQARAALRAAASGRVAPSPRAVGIVICTKDKGHLLRQLVRSLDLANDPRVAELVVISNNTTNPFAKDFLAELALDPKVRIVRQDANFNFSRFCNIGARLCASDRLLFLNDDIAPITADWLSRLLDGVEEPEVGVVGPLLLYPDERVQHAGMYLGFKGIAGHTLRHARLPEQDYLFYASAPREVSSVTGAAMLVRRECFEALNGFDEQLATYLQDVDLCLRARRAGFAVVFDPRATLLHMESASVRALDQSSDLARQRGLEHAYFLRRWGGSIGRDAFHNPAFGADDESLHTLAIPSR